MFHIAVSCSVSRLHALCRIHIPGFTLHSTTLTKQQNQHLKSETYLYLWPFKFTPNDPERSNIWNVVFILDFLLHLIRKLPLLCTVRFSWRLENLFICDVRLQVIAFYARVTISWSAGRETISGERNCCDMSSRGAIRTFSLL